MSSWLWIVSILLGLLLLAGGGVWVAGPERMWALMGPADLGHVDFEKLERRTSPNDALACPSDFCRAQSDMHPPLFNVSIEVLRKAMARALKSERRLTLVAINDAIPSDRYVQRSEVMHFPDTIIVRYIALPDGSSTVAIYSRSQLGKKDFGVNLERIERWLEKLSVEVGKIETV